MSEGYIEKALLKIARQLNAYDEASLMDLWERYAEKVRRFEPTRKWEEAALMFSLIQSMRLKNQLFNYHWAQSRVPDAPQHDIDLASLTAPEPIRKDAEEGTGSRTGKILEFRPKPGNAGESGPVEDE